MPNYVDGASDAEFTQAIADATQQGRKDDHSFLKAAAVGYLVGKAVKSAKRKDK